MLTSLVMLLLPVDPVETEFAQVHPVRETTWVRSPGQTKATVLIHGFRLRYTEASIRKAAFLGWQKPGSPLVEALAELADVYSFAYGQDASLETIVGLPALGSRIRRLRSMGYSEIILIGHSAGGLLARYFVEDRPDSGVTKVIQVCSPNGGCALGNARFGLLESQEAFARSLTPEARQRALARRRDRTIPEDTGFVCIVGTAAGPSDGMVACDHQWSEDLRAQGIPAVAVDAFHFTIVRTKAGALVIAQLVRENQPRWRAEKVAAVARTISGIGN